jgi:hypothetical protein
MLYYGLIPFLLLIVILLFLKNIKNKSLVKNNNGGLVDNFSSQGNFYKRNSTVSSNLSEDEKIELSWQFLYTITDYVLKKFSRQDVDLVHNIGKKLVTLGVAYQHVVEYGIMSYKDNAKLILEEREANSKKQASL